jgi:hypothetical protein
MSEWRGGVDCAAAAAAAPSALALAHSLLCCSLSSLNTPHHPTPARRSRVPARDQEAAGGGPAPATVRAPGRAVLHAPQEDQPQPHLRRLQARRACGGGGKGAELVAAAVLRHTLLRLHVTDSDVTTHPPPPTDDLCSPRRTRATSLSGCSRASSRGWAAWRRSPPCTPTAGWWCVVASCDGGGGGPTRGWATSGTVCELSPSRSPPLALLSHATHAPPHTCCRSSPACRSGTASATRTSRTSGSTTRSPGAARSWRGCTTRGSPRAPRASASSSSWHTSRACSGERAQAQQPEGQSARGKAASERHRADLAPALPS